ncbi:MAG: helix-turn-helix domain-containing protein, partial [Pyrinomonadaceae bacterium]
MELRVIKSEDDYHLVLQEAERLVARDPAAGSTDADRLELLTVLIEDYEHRQFPFETPDPIDAIEFRMHEQGLRQRDLVPLIGSRSRVSEVLARKRPLNVPMIRALSTGLGIPLEALVSAPTLPNRHFGTDVAFDWAKFPIREMQKRGWLDSIRAKSSASAEEIVKAFLQQVTSGGAKYALYRRNFKGEEVDQKSYYSTRAWSARVLIRA